MKGKKLSRRDFLHMGALTAAGAALAACAPATPLVVEKEVPVTVEKEVPVEVEKVVVVTVPAAAEVTLLTFGHHWDVTFRPRQEDWDNIFMERHPDIAIKRTNNTWAEHNAIVPTWAAAGKLPDIIYVHGAFAFPWNHEGIMVSIQDYVDTDAEFNVGGVWEEALRLYRYKGKQYEIPYDHGPCILGFNKDLFDEAGVPYPDETWTMDDLLENAKKLTKEGQQQWGMGDYYGNYLRVQNEIGMPKIGPWGGRVFNDEETEILLGSPESLKALNWWYDTIHKHKVAPNLAEMQAVPGGPWLAGMTAMAMVPTWMTPQLTTAAAFSWDVAPWPAGPAGRKTGSFGSGFGITRDCKHPDVAWSYLREYLSVEGMEFMWGESGRGSPAREAAYQSWLDSEFAPEHAEYFLDALKNYAVTGHPYQTLAAREIVDIFNRHTDLLESGDMAVEEAVQAIIEEGTPVLQDAYKRLMG